MNAKFARAGQAAHRAARHPVVTWTARAGLVGFGLVHLLIAWLAVRIATGQPAAEGDSSGALRHLAAQPTGRWLVGAIGVGLVAMVVWQATRALAGPYEAEAGKITERIVAGARAVVYGAAASTAFGVLNAQAPSNAASQQTATAHLMSATGGRWWVGAAGVAVAAVGVGMAGYGVLGKFADKLATEQMSATVRRLSRVLGTAGYCAKGVAYALVGVLVVVAAVQFEPDKSRGLDAALRSLADQPAGGWLLGVVAFGFACYGVHCGVQARFRKDL